ncbi:hypothetical protein D3C78_1093460 [compost metagenome]
MPRTRSSQKRRPRPTPSGIWSASSRTDSNSNRPSMPASPVRAVAVPPSQATAPRSTSRSALEAAWLMATPRLPSSRPRPPCASWSNLRLPGRTPSALPASRPSCAISPWRRKTWRRLRRRTRSPTSAARSPPWRSRRRIWKRPKSPPLCRMPQWPPLPRSCRRWPPRWGRP